MVGRESPDALDEGLGGGDGLLGEEIGQQAGIQPPGHAAALQEDADLRREEQAPGPVPAVIEGFDAHSIPRQKHAPAVGIVEGQSEHPLEPIQGALPHRAMA